MRTWRGPRWEEHSVGPGRRRESLAVTRRDMRAGREKKTSRDQAQERVEQTIVVCGPKQHFSFYSE